MCDVCATGGEEITIDVGRLWPVARAIEARMTGVAVTEGEWRIFIGAQSGAIGFDALQRLTASRVMALREIAAETRPAPRKAGFFCEAITPSN